MEIRNGREEFGGEWLPVVFTIQSLLLLFVSISHTQQDMCKQINIDPRGSKATLLIKLFLISQHFGTTNQQDMN